MDSHDLELRAEGLSLLYPQEDGSKRGLLPFSASFRPGRLHLIEGESGSGKTTLLSLLSLLERPGEGRVLLGGKEISSPSSKEGALRKGRESFSLSLRELDYLPSLTIGENLRVAGGDVGKATRILSDLGLGERLGDRASLLSTGELQRLSLALAIASPAPVLILDEPTANLDEGRRAIALRYIEREAARRIVVLAAHDYLPAEGGRKPHRIVLSEGRALCEEEGEDFPVPPPEEGERLLPAMRGRNLFSLAFRRRKGLFKSIFAGAFSLLLSFLATSVLSLPLPDASLYYRSILEEAGEEAALVTDSDGGSPLMKANSWMDLRLISWLKGDAPETNSFALLDKDGIYDFGLSCLLEADEIGFPASMLEEMGNPETVTIFRLPFRTVSLPYEPGTALQGRAFLTREGLGRLLEEAAVFGECFSPRAVRLANRILSLHPEMAGIGDFPYVMSRSLAGDVALPERSFAIVLSEENEFAPEPYIGEEIPLLSPDEVQNDFLPDLPPEVESLTLAKVIRMPAGELPFNADIGHGIVYSEDMSERLLEDMEDHPVGWTGTRFVPTERIGASFFDGNLTEYGEANYDGIDLLGDWEPYYFGQYIEKGRIAFLALGFFLLALLLTALAYGALLVRQSVMKDELSLELRGSPFLLQKAPGLLRFLLLFGVPVLLGALLSPLGAEAGSLFYGLIMRSTYPDPPFLGPSWGASFLALGLSLLALFAILLPALYLPSRKSLLRRLRMRREGEE